MEFTFQWACERALDFRYFQRVRFADVERRDLRAGIHLHKRNFLVILEHAIHKLLGKPFHLDVAILTMGLSATSWASETPVSRSETQPNVKFVFF